MERLTTNKDVSEMGMYELAHNSCYAKDGKARYRDYDLDIDARELTRKLLKDHADGDDSFTDDEDFDEWMMDYLQHGMDSIEGLLALFYRNLWAMADLRERLAEYEDLEEQKRLIKLPCAVGDTVYHICAFKYGETETIEMKVVCVEPFGAIRNHKGVCEIWNVYAETDYTKEYFKFFDFGKTIFLTKEEAEAALKELERGKGE